MSKEQIKQALISILIGAITIFITQILQGLLGLVNQWLANGTGAAVATGTYIIKNKIILWI
jgi:hypothetical protein